MSECQSTSSSNTDFESDWIGRLLEECEREAEDFRNVKILRTGGRDAVWNVCEMFGCSTRGVPGQACRLLERYIYKLLHSHTNINDPSARQVLLNDVTPRLLLMITCCVLLAAKMNSADTLNNASLIRIALLTRGVSYTTEEINTTEAEIFKTLNFRVPLWTSVDMGELLAAELKLPSKVLDKLSLITNLAEYHQADIEERILWVVKLSHQADNVGCIRTLHLSAGAVAAAVKLSSIEPDPTPTLAQLLRISRSYVECLRDVILVILLKSEKGTKSLKRKHSPTILS